MTTPEPTTRTAAGRAPEATPSEGLQAALSLLDALSRPLDGPRDYEQGRCYWCASAVAHDADCAWAKARHFLAAAYHEGGA